MRRLAAHLVFTPGGLLPDRVVTISDEGVIVDISTVSGAAGLDGEAGVEFFGGILCPGFVNAHCHLELSDLQGLIPQGGGLTAFAQGMRRAREKGLPRAQNSAENGPREAEIEAENGPRKAENSAENGPRKTEIAAGKQECPPSQTSSISFWDSKMHREGVAAVADICNGDSTFAVKRDSPVLYHSFCELFGLNADPKRAFDLRDKALSAGLNASVTPHSLYSLNRDAFAAAVENENEKKLSLSVHFMESEEEADLFKRRGAMWQWYENQGFNPDFIAPEGENTNRSGHFRSPAERLVAQVPPDRPVMLIHNCAVTQRDIDIVTGHFTAPVTWVLCPRSNRYISKTTPPFQLLRKNGLRIAIGTDSPASNESLSMVREMAEIKGVPLEELLMWATMNGAQALGLQNRLGSIEIGKSPGIVLLTGVNMQSLSLSENSAAIRLF
jgi:cytosine/adenosine deaminase-related metal-dependent hydrolase